jgi:hypothetical protein
MPETSLGAIGSARVTELIGMLDVAAFAASVTAGSSRHWRILPAFL